jgi:uncharacterized RDD family membrane protein YckC
MDLEQGKPLLWEKVALSERLLAAFVDLVIVVGLSLFPRIGWMVGLIYHLTRDSLPFLNGQSFGKKFFNLRVIILPQYASMSGAAEKSVIRGLVAIIPGLNIVDLWFLITRKVRLADEWAETRVVYHQDWETIGN